MGQGGGDTDNSETDKRVEIEMLLSYVWRRGTQNITELCVKTHPPIPRCESICVEMLLWWKGTQNGVENQICSLLQSKNLLKKTIYDTLPLSLSLC